MTSSRTLVARTVATVALALVSFALAGCGGDDGGGGDGGGPSGTSAEGGVPDGQGGTVPAMQGEDCDAEVTLTGAVDQSWSGEGKVDTSESDVAPPATYQSIDGDTMLTVASTGNGFDEPTVILLVDGRSFGVAPGEGSVEVADDGSGATLDAPAAEIGTDEVAQVEATFSC